MRGDSKTKGASSAKASRPNSDRATRSGSAEPANDVNDAEAAGAESVDVPLNRAERRARGKKAGQQQAAGQGHGKVAGAKGPVQSPRMWANRRSG